MNVRPVPVRELHPNRGPHNPRLSLPDLKAGSVRRTTTIDTNRPDGIMGHVEVDARSRDMRVVGGSFDGGFAGELHGEILATAEMDATVDVLEGRTLLRLEVKPHLDLSGLVNQSVMRGFRDRIDTAYPGGRTSHSLSYQLLDDLPTALLVSGYAFGAAGVRPAMKGPRQQFPDLCAGFVAGGSMLVEEAETGNIPVVTGPVAPILLGDHGRSAADSAGSPTRETNDSGPCHQVGMLGPHSMRRLRVLDVWASVASSQFIEVENYFRDSHMSPDGLETVVHEYTVRATYDLLSDTFGSTEATAHTLPWTECPLAAASATRVEGTPAKGMRIHVRGQFVGPSTCTHLNDTLRAMEDVPGLAEQLRQ